MDVSRYTTGPMRIRICRSLIEHLDKISFSLVTTRPFAGSRIQTEISRSKVVREVHAQIGSIFVHFVNVFVDKGA